MAGKQYEKATKAQTDLIAQVMDEHYSQLVQLGVTVETLVVFGPRNSEGIQTGPALTVRGREAYACIRISKLEERVVGRGDALMKIDGDRWKKLSHETQVALIDHELMHLELVPDLKNDAEFCTDDAGRIRLKIRQHDFEVGWFTEVAGRHGDASIEVQQAASLLTYSQQYFPGWDIKPLSLAAPSDKPKRKRA